MYVSTEQNSSYIITSTEIRVAVILDHNKYAFLIEIWLEIAHVNFLQNE